MVKKKMTVLQLKKWTKEGFKMVVNTLIEQGKINRSIDERIHCLAEISKLQDKQIDLMHKQIIKLKKNK